jgi:hypothetical protein
MAPVKGPALPPDPSTEEFLRCESTTSAADPRIRAAAVSTMKNRVS